MRIFAASSLRSLLKEKKRYAYDYDRGNSSQFLFLAACFADIVEFKLYLQWLNEGNNTS